MRSVQFRNGLKRILYHEQQGDSTMTKDERVTALVHSLCNVDVVVVDELRSSFVLKASGEDVTRESKGSDRLVVRAANDSALYLAPKNPVRVLTFAEYLRMFIVTMSDSLLHVYRR